MKNKAKISRSLRQGGYLAGVTAGVLAVVILLNLMVGQLPSNWKEFDLTDNSLYEITDTSKDFLSGLSQDVQIVVLAEDGTTDARIEKFLDRYVALSSHLSLSYVDPVAHPQEASQYDADSDSVVVLCEATGKSRDIPFSDIITTSYTSYFSSTESGFDAEGQLTSAVDYVTGDASYTVYTVTGHGEEDLSDPITSAIEKANLNLESVSPALEGGVPEDCDVLVVNGPTTDLSESERTLLEDYLAGGGHMVFLPGDTLTSLPNWEALLEGRGLKLVDGYIADPGSYYPQLGSAFAICGVLSTYSPVTDGCDSSSLTLLTNSRGFEALDPGTDEDWTITTFLSTTSQGVAVTEDDQQTQGTYVLGAVADGSDGGRLTVFGSSSLLNGQIISQNPSLVNQTLFMNALTATFDDTSTMSIPAKSLETTYNTIQNPGLWSTTYLIILPVGILLCGFIFWMKRRKL